MIKKISLPVGQALKVNKDLFHLVWKIKSECCPGMVQLIAFSRVPTQLESFFN